MVRADELVHDLGASKRLVRPCHATFELNALADARAADRIGSSYSMSSEGCDALSLPLAVARAHRYAHVCPRVQAGGGQRDDAQACVRACGCACKWAKV